MKPTDKHIESQITALETVLKEREMRRTEALVSVKPVILYWLYTELRASRRAREKVRAAFELADSKENSVMRGIRFASVLADADVKEWLG